MTISRANWVPAFAGTTMVLSLLAPAQPAPVILKPGAAAQLLPYEAKAMHLGVVNCASSLCHGSVTSWKDSNVLQNEYVTWSRVDKHSTRAYQVLLEERSQRIARNLGLKEPAHKAKICLDCHTHNPPAALRGERFKPAEGIGCEACHGPAEKWIDAKTDTYVNTAKAALDAFTALIADARAGRQIKG